jgi:hypothetical protein
MTVKAFGVEAEWEEEMQYPSGLYSILPGTTFSECARGFGIREHDAAQYIQVTSEKGLIDERLP